MDVEPIYCAEQIVVPAGLDEVLKNFTKEAVRRQPQDLLAFAAKYFADAAALQRSISAVEAPTQQQLSAAFSSMRATPAVPLADVEAACVAAGINAATLAHVVKAGNVNTAREVSVLEVLLLLLTMRCGSLGAVLRGAFDVFGEPAAGEGGGEPRLEVPTLLQLLGFLGARDPEVTPALRDSASRALEGHVTVTLKALAGVPALAAKLAGV
ncbi:hypothetical protein Rsub_01123 [Raphidocelis subcapitata]|uniref:RIIa domain-containing protein n=1 Tax=Raphidocelis subcapitata TaxID=307507 RepID=A0A2V0NLU9_9CHLO|nr:hypothetical protein Rsub_01123 [Raphidocelis subcapitata]|eukprot:GBF88411.1 hypothetical protein Rsub_01123 [Raphidocelis subcapitata]